MTARPSPRPRLALTDESLRDGPQSLWGSRMTTDTMVDVASEIDRAGYEKAVVVSGATFEAAVRHLREDPWERLDAVTALMPHTPCVAQIRGRTLFGWQQYPDDVVELFMKTLVRHGIDWFLIFEALNDMTMIEQHVRVAASMGVPVTVPICYSVSPVHTPEYFADVMLDAARMHPAGVSVVDASGLLDPDATHGLVRAANAALHGSGTCLEMNVHDLTGQGLAVYAAALDAGVDALATLPRAVAYGKSLPAVVDVLHEATARGIETQLDDRRIQEAEAYFAWAAHVGGHEVPRSRRLGGDELEAFIGHQIPGGMMSNLIRQLRDLSIEERLPEILDEAALVREELGFPVMVTPCSQMVGVQATLNVVSGERYVNAPTELKAYLSGIYGRPPGKISEFVLDRVLGDEPMVDPHDVFTRPMLPGFKEANGTFSSDEDLLLAVLYGRQALTTLQQTKTTVRRTPRTAVSALVEEILRRFGPSHMRLKV